MKYLMLAPFLFILGAQIVMAQVEIHQSTSINGHTNSVVQDNGKTIVKTSHGTLTVSGDHLKYCAQKCSSYIMMENGTLSSIRIGGTP